MTSWYRTNLESKLGVMVFCIHCIFALLWDPVSFREIEMISEEGRTSGRFGLCPSDWFYIFCSVR